VHFDRVLIIRVSLASFNSSRYKPPVNFHFFWNGSTSARVVNAAFSSSFAKLGDDEDSIFAIKSSHFCQIWVKVMKKSCAFAHRFELNTIVAMRVDATQFQKCAPLITFL